MDPWQVVESVNPNQYSDGKITANSLHDTLEFEDNFRPPISDKLPDSDEYIALLEAKLQKIRADPNFLRQLSEKRAECMQALLNSDGCDRDEAIDLDTPVESSAILRTILPQRQALTHGELVDLVNYDQLTDEADSGNNTDD